MFIFAMIVTVIGGETDGVLIAILVSPPLK